MAVCGMGSFIVLFHKFTSHITIVCTSRVLMTYLGYNGSDMSCHSVYSFMKQVKESVVKQAFGDCQFSFFVFIPRNTQTEADLCRHEIKHYQSTAWEASLLGFPWRKVIFYMCNIKQFLLVLLHRKRAASCDKMKHVWKTMFYYYPWSLLNMHSWNCMWRM